MWRGLAVTYPYRSVGLIFNVLADASSIGNPVAVMPVPGAGQQKRGGRGRPFAVSYTAPRGQAKRKESVSNW